MIGINYTGTAHALTGCVRDALFHVEKLKKHMGMKEKDITLLADDVPGCRRPTRVHILEALRKLQITSHRVPLQPLWISYSGHGASQLDEMGGDEKDGRDETWLPCDFETAGHITDDTLRTLFSRIHPQTTVVGLSDSCHSGTMFDLPYLVTVDGHVQVGPRDAYAAGPRMLLIGACQDDQTAAETVVGPTMTVQGVMTHAFWKVVEEAQCNLTCTQLMERMTAWLTQQGYTQRPQLSCSEPVILAHFALNRQTRPFLQLL